MTPPRKRSRPEVPPETARAILAAIRKAEAPVRSVDLAKTAEPVGKVKGPDVVLLLTGSVAAGEVFAWGTAKAPAYWHRNQKGEARNRLLAAAKGALLTAKELTARVAAVKPAIAAGVVTSARVDLVREKRFVEVAAAPGGKAKRFVDTHFPEVYLETEIARLLKAFGREQPVERVRELLAPARELAKPTFDEQVAEVAEKMLAAVNRVAFSPGTTVTFYRLRQQPELAEIPKALFDAAALQLRRDRKVLLSLHDHAAALASSERERFVTDGLGTYYVSIYAR